MTSLGLEAPWLAPVSAAAVATAAIAFARAYRVRRRLAELYPPGEGWLRYWLLPNTARLVAVVLLAVAALGPVAVRMERVYIESPSTLIATPIDTPVLHIILVDVSKSMTGERVAEAVEFLEGYLQGLPRGALVEVYVFAASVEGPLCSGPPAGCASIVAEIPRMTGRRYTALGDAILAGLAAQRGRGLPAVVAVITDGASNYGARVGDALAAAKAQKALLLLVLVGEDPRAASLLKEARRHGVHVVYAGSPKAAELEAKRAALEASYRALRQAGAVYLETRVRDPLPTLALVAAAAVLLALSRLEGV